MPPERSAPAWKGLDTTRRPIFLGYDQTERMLSALLDRAAAWRPEVVVGIARGGVVPATMAATILALPVATIAYNRAESAAFWIGPPPESARVLLVDDGCSTGGTMRAVRAMLLAEGRDCLTLAVVHDPDHASYVPDLSHAMRDLWRFPWERGEATPAARAARSAGHGPDRITELPFSGLDLDGVFCRDIDPADYDADLAAALAARDLLPPHRALPFFSPERAVVITGRPEMDRARTLAWLARHGHGALPLECRPADVAHDIASVARHKAAAATRWGCTHFVESDPKQAILIAASAPHLIVTWWSREMDSAYTVGAAVNIG